MDSQLARLCDAYFRSWMAADPFTATEFGVTGYDAEVPDPSREADSARIAELERLGAEVARLDPATLTPDERVSRSMLLRLAADEREELGGRLDELAVTATSVGAQTRVLTLVPRAPLNEPRRARDYLDRCRKLGGYLDGALARHLEAAREGRLPTARGVAQAVAQLDDYLASDLKDDPLLRPEPPEGVDAEAWRAEAAEIVRTVVRPAMGRYRSALAEELAPAARDDDHAGVVNVEGGLGAYGTTRRCASRPPRRSWPPPATRCGAPRRPCQRRSWPTRSRPARSRRSTRSRPRTRCSATTCRPAPTVPGRASSRSTPTRRPAARASSTTPSASTRASQGITSSSRSRSAWRPSRSSGASRT